ncbi:MAG: ATP-binding protein [Flavobacteriaceae bacterium]|nr:ATP-binding protein [Flavobacteriaceae bacterium]
MKTKRIVITGGPGSGKTALINYLEKEGYAVMHEISRNVILEAQKEGIEQLFLENPILFSEKLLEGRLKQFHEGKDSGSAILFYDRGMPDVTAYMNFVNSPYPENFSKTCLDNRYDEIFVLPPWEAIYEQDNERYESFGQAEKIFNFLKNGYENYGYKAHEVPVGTIEERVDFILKNIGF